MNTTKNKIKLALELAKENPGLDTEKLMSLIGLDGEVFNDEESLTSKVMKENKENTPKITVRRKRYTEEDDKVLIHMKGLGKSNKDIANALNRSEDSINSRFTLLNRNGKFENLATKRHRYSKEEDSLIKSELKRAGGIVRNVPKETIDTIASIIGVPPTAIVTRMHNNFRKEYKSN